MGRRLHVFRQAGHLIAAFLLMALAACVSDEGADGQLAPVVPISSTETEIFASISGAAQKGPFVKGTRVLVNRLSEKGDNTYETAISAIDDDSGNFTFPVKSAGPILIEADGIHLNEISGKLSRQRLQLRAIYNVTSNPTQNAYINVLTHLAYKRVLKLLRQGVPVEDAINQGEATVVESLRAVLPAPKSGAFTSLSLFNSNDRDGSGDAYLLAISAAITQYAMDKQSADAQTTVDSQLAYILSYLADDIAESGRISSAEVISKLTLAVRAVDPDKVRENLQNRSFNVGKVKLPVADMNLFIDTDGDGTVNAADDDSDDDGIINALDTSPYLFASTPALTVPSEFPAFQYRQKVEFGWTTSVKRQHVLQVQFTSNQDFSEDLENYSVTTDSLKKQFDRSGTYYLRARIENPFGQAGEWSTTKKFSVGEFSRQFELEPRGYVNDMITTRDGGYLLMQRMEQDIGGQLGRIVKLDGLGNVLWKSELTPPSIVSGTLELADGTIVQVGSSIFSCCAPIRISAFSKDGRSLWDNRAPFEQSAVGSITNMVEMGGKLYVMYDGYRMPNHPIWAPMLFTIDVKSGRMEEIVTSTSVNPLIESSGQPLAPTFGPLIGDALTKDAALVYSLNATMTGNFILGYRTACLGSYDCYVNRLAAFDPLGHLIWTKSNESRSLAGSPTTVGHFSEFSAFAQTASDVGPILDSDGNVVPEEQIWYALESWRRVHITRKGTLFTLGGGYKLLLPTGSPAVAVDSLPCAINCVGLSSATGDGGFAYVYGNTFVKVGDADKYPNTP